MSEKTSIEWTKSADGTAGGTWNPIRARSLSTGKVGHYCELTSSGCRSCYASRMQTRFGLPEFPGEGKCNVITLPTVASAPGRIPVSMDLEVYLDEKVLTAPLRWKKGRFIFPCSMTDLFGRWVPDEWLDKIFAVMALAKQHTFQVLTKRAERMRQYLTDYAAGGRHIWEAAQGIVMPRGQHKPATVWPLSNVWLGVSAENQATAYERIPKLLQTPAALRWVSYEPALSAVDFTKWLGYYPVHETKSTSGNASSGGDNFRGTGNRQHGANLADSQAGLGSLAQDSRSAPLQTGASGEQTGWQERLSSNQGDAKQASGASVGSSCGLPILSGTDTGRSDDQSRERNQVGQPAKQLGSDDLLGEFQARLPDGPEGSKRRSESSRQVERHGDGENQKPLFDGEDDTSGNRSDVRSGIPNYLENREGGEAQEASGTDSGLRPQTQSSKQASERARGILFLVCGGESGPRARPFDLAWARSARDQCAAAGVAYFFKQAGSNPGVTKTRYDACDEEVPDGRLPLKLRDKKGGDLSEFPADLRVRQFPEVRVNAVHEDDGNPD